MRRRERETGRVGEEVNGRSGEGATRRQGDRAKQSAIRNRLVALAFLPFAFCLLTFDFSSNAAVTFAPQLMVNLEKGRVIYASSCGNSYCHGSEGKGGGAPKLLDKPYTATFLRKIVSDGIAGTPMPGFKERFTAEEINQLVGYLLSLSPGKADPPPSAFAPPAAAPNSFAAAHGASGGENKGENKAASTTSASVAPSNFTVDLRGNAAAGRELFYDATVIATCRSCHSVNGVGGKVASDLGRFRALAPRDVLQALLDTSKPSDAKYATMVVTLKSGEKITGVKRDDSPADVRIYDTTTMPPISRSYLRTEIANIETKPGTVCPGNYASKYSLQQLLDLISFFKSENLRNPANVSLKEIF